MIGEEDQALGFTTARAEGLAFLAANLSTVANVAIGAATAFTVFKTGTYIRDMSQRVAITQQQRAATIATARAEVAAANEIGRASCRARVCQYVSISVVAGSLKQKKHQRRTQTHYPRTMTETV